MSTTPLPGGFLPPPFPSPSPSVSSPRPTTTLPHPRSTPLRAGSNREETTRRWVENALLKVSRRYVKKFQPEEMRGADGGGVGRGYERMGEVCGDLGEVVDVLWRSGTPSLQIPYLFNIALAVSTYLPSFPAAPGATFGLLRKMDHALASLLAGRDVGSGEVLPGLEEEGSGMSRTDMVRCKSIVEQTRVVVVEVMGREGEVEDESVDAGTGTEDEMTDGGDTQMGWDEEEEDESALHDMDVAKVYENTIVRLDEALNRGTAYDVGASG
ncbi:hypothetical protein VE03_10102 [Pseudogymnoascus sp. 23342-1-I1]|nr:hypothetical protein VE03_10102 [Pseudogymnoascus sp. 23342-1-I1]